MSEARPKRVRKLSKRARRAQGLPSDSEAPSDSEESDSSFDVPRHTGRDVDDDAAAPPSSPFLATASLSRTTSTSSLVSAAAYDSTTATSGSRSEDVKRIKFEERYETATSTDEQVLGKQAP